MTHCAIPFILFEPNLFFFSPRQPQPASRAPLYASQKRVLWSFLPLAPLPKLYIPDGRILARDNSSLDAANGSTVTGGVWHPR